MYKLTTQNIIVRLSDNASIPFDYDNRDYADFLLWKSSGGIPQPADVPVKIYQPLSAWQVRKVLTASGLHAQVEAAVLAADQDTQDAWHYASNFQRDDPILNAMAVSLGITPKDLDNIFDLGITL
jgi:hypothetical protein